MIQEFWDQFRRQYVNILQSRQKWLTTERTIKTGDIVLEVNPNVPRNCWPLARVVECIHSSDNLVRSVKIKVGTSTYVRPVAKIVFLFETD